MRHLTVKALRDALQDVDDSLVVKIYEPLDGAGAYVAVLDALEDKRACACVLVTEDRG